VGVDARSWHARHTATSSDAETFFFSVGGLGLGFVRNSTWVGGWVVMVVHMWVGPVVVGGSTANSDAKNTTAFVAVGLS